MHAAHRLIGTFLLLLPALVRGAYDDVLRDHAAAEDQVKSLMAAKAWNQLEDLANDWRDTEARFSDGRWKLERFYEAADVDSILSLSRPDPEWLEWLEGLRGWEEAFPDSPTLATVRGKFWTSYAWKARGGGWASTVSDQGWKDFAARLEEGAREMQEFAAKVPGGVVPCPGFYAAWHVYALGQGWPVAEARRLVEAVQKRWPDYHGVYSAHAYYLLPRWHGEPGAWEAFAGRVYEENPGGQGAEIYARMAWVRYDDEVDFFESSDVEWKRMREGFLRMMERFPRSGWNLSAFIQFATLANDLESLGTWYGSVGKEAIRDAPAGPGWAEGMHLWMDQGLPGPVTPRKRIRPAEISPRNAARSLAVAPDGRWFAAGYQGGQLLVASLPEGGVLSCRQVARALAGDVAVSPDGTLLAMAFQRYSGNDPEHAPNAVILFDMQDPTQPWELRRFEDFPAGIHSVRFSPDSRTLLVGGGPYDRGGQPACPFYVWDRISGELRECTTLDGAGVIDAMTFAHDGDTVAFSINQTVWEASPSDGYATNRLVLPKEVHRGDIRGIALSANGEWMVSVSNKGWEARHRLNGKLVVTNRSRGTHRTVDLAGHAMAGLCDLALAGPESDPVLITSGYDGWLRFWDGLETGDVTLRTIYPGSGGPVWRVAAGHLPDGEPLLVTAAQDGILAIYRF